MALSAPPNRHSWANKRLINRALPPYQSTRRNVLRALVRTMQTLPQIQRHLAATYSSSYARTAQAAQECLDAGWVTLSRNGRYVIVEAWRDALLVDDAIGVEAPPPAVITPAPYRPPFRPLAGMQLLRPLREGANDFKAWESVG